MLAVAGEVELGRIQADSLAWGGFSVPIPIRTHRSRRDHIIKARPTSLSFPGIGVGGVEFTMAPICLSEISFDCCLCAVRSLVTCRSFVETA